MPTPLLQTKLYIPPVRPEMVLRPRLLQRLDEGLRLGRKLTLVSAPAGFGKTTLLSEWIHAGVSSREYGVGEEHEPASGVSFTPYSLLPAPRFAWLSLDEGDNDLARFLGYLVAALQTIEGNVGQGLWAALQSPGPVNVESVLTTLLNEITGLSDSPPTGLRQAQADSSGRGLILVLDDYHVIESQPIDEALTFLLDHLPPQMHLGLATRTDPTLPLSRLRARGQLTELRAADLRFTTEEATTFLKQVVRLPISSDDVRTLEDRTEGWITGLQLAAVTMQSLKGREQIARFIDSFGGSHRYVIDYLVDEVLDQQTSQVQAFLLQTSILDRMTAPLCNFVTSREDSQAILERLEAANLFLVPLDGERRWYRYHHLFAHLLRQRLHQNPPPLSSPPTGGKERGGVAEYHIRASAWYEENSLEIEALHHAAAANDFERAARLIEGDGMMPMYFRGAATPVLNWLESLPPSMLDARPSLWVVYAEVLLIAGWPADVEEKLQAAEAALQDAKPDAHIQDLLGRIASMRATVAIGQRQPESIIALSRRALDLLHPDNLATRAAVSLNLGYAYQLQGDRASASQALAEAIAISQVTGNTIVAAIATIRLGNMQAAENRVRQAAQTYQRALQLTGEQPLPLAGEAHLGLARISYEWNDLDAAQRHGQQSVQLARLIEGSNLSIACEVLLARLKLAQGDVAGAAAILDQANQSARQRHFMYLMPEVAAAQVLTLLHQGDLAAAARLAQTHELPISQARVHLAQGNAAAALATLEPLRQQMEAKGWQDETLKVMVLQAVALHRMQQHPPHGEEGDAVQLLGDALALAEPGGFIRTFVDEGEPMAQLLCEAAARGIMSDYTGKLLAAFEGAKKDEGRTTELSPLSLVEPLSERELEVLQLVAQGLSNREISERLYLVLDTVKGHNRRIYAKLGVKNRTQAINKARALNILPPQ